MTSMIDKISRGIAETKARGVSLRQVLEEVSYRGQIPWEEEKFLSDMQTLARAAVEAMRSPDERMIAAAWTAIGAHKAAHGLGKLGPGPAFAEAYRAALDTILEGK